MKHYSDCGCVSCLEKHGTTVKTPMETRLMKVVCEDCGYTIRVTNKWLMKAYPICANGHKGKPMVDGKPGVYNKKKTFV